MLKYSFMKVLWYIEAMSVQFGYYLTHYSTHPIVYCKGVTFMVCELDLNLKNKPIQSVETPSMLILHQHLHNLSAQVQINRVEERLRGKVWEAFKIPWLHLKDSILYNGNKKLRQKYKQSFFFGSTNLSLCYIIIYIFIWRVNKA